MIRRSPGASSMSVVKLDTANRAPKLAVTAARISDVPRKTRIAVVASSMAGSWAMRISSSGGAKRSRAIVPAPSVSPLGGRRPSIAASSPRESGNKWANPDNCAPVSAFSTSPSLAQTMASAASSRLASRSRDSGGLARSRPTIARMAPAPSPALEAAEGASVVSCTEPATDMNSKGERDRTR